MQAKKAPAAGNMPSSGETQAWNGFLMRPDLHAPPEAQTSATGMPGPVQAKMERAFNADFSGVRIHASSSRAGEMGARAFTQGKDVHFAPGQYDPSSTSGQELLGHELTHVVQQSQGRVSATTQAKGIGLNDDAALEAEADELGARAARGEVARVGGSRDLAFGGGVVQRKEREEGDLDYGFSGRRGKAMRHATRHGQDHRGDVCPTVDDLNKQAGVTKYMKRFAFHDLLDLIRAFTPPAPLPADTNEKYVVAWLAFLKANIDRIDLTKQVNAAIGPMPAEATKDKLNKNKDSKNGAPPPDTIREWHRNKVIPVDADERELLEEWVWNAFFRITSKLGLEFARDQGHAIHFNISQNAYGKALAGRGSKARHSRNAITYSELRHLKRLHDRGNAPEVHFQDNDGGVHDVDSPFESLDMLDASGIRRLYRTAEWKKESVDFETRLGSYIATSRPEAKDAVQAGLTKMDSVLRKNNDSHGKDDYREHRKAFGKTKKNSAGQVGEGRKTLRSVIKGTPRKGHDPINLREQMTAAYNASFWNGGTTIKNVLTEVGQIEDAAERKAAAAKVGIGEDQINEIHDLIRSQIQESRDKISVIGELPRAQRVARAETDFDLDTPKATRLVSKISALKKDRRGYKAEKDAATRKIKREAYFTSKWELARKHTKLNILGTAIDTDDSRPARKKRTKVDKVANKKSAKDYADMGVGLSNRERKAIGGIADETAKLPWVEGLAYYRIDETTGWGKEMKKKGFPTVAGNSGTTARMLQVYTWLGAGPALDFRLAIMGWMLPCRDHSLMEIMQGAKTVGVEGPGESLASPVDMYKTIAPLSSADLRAHAGKDGLFPEERVLRTVDDPTYKKLIKQK